MKRVIPMTLSPLLNIENHQVRLVPITLRINPSSFSVRLSGSILTGVGAIDDVSASVGSSKSVGSVSADCAA